MKGKRFLQWLPGIISEILAVVFCVIYALNGGEKITMYFQLTVSALLPLLVPLYGVITKKPLHIGLAIVFSVFVFFASNLGSALGFYNSYFCYDLIIHGAFGFICSFTVFTLLVRWNGAKLNPIGFIVIIFVFTMGVAALWEVFEYLADRVTGGDAQRIYESISLGKSPVSDTMEDIMIAMAGSILFLLALLADKINKYKFCIWYCGFNGFVKEQN